MRQKSATKRTRPLPRQRIDSVWCRRRRLIVVDVENVVGGPCDTAAKVEWARRRVLDVLRPDLGDQVVLAVDGGALEHAAFAWPGARVLSGRGESGADRRLLEVLADEVVGRFHHVVLVSGDGIFTDAAAELAVQGIAVTVVSHECSLSAQLRLSATSVVLLSEIGTTPSAAHSA